VISFPTARVRILLIAAWLAVPLAGCGGQGLDAAARPPDPQVTAYVAEFHRIDTAGKGVITFDQATAYYTAKFHELDRAKKGFLLAPDIAPMLPLMGATTAEDLLSRLDNNADGKVTLQEFLIIPNALFQKARSNPNALTLDEVAAGAGGAPGKAVGNHQGKQRGQSGGVDMGGE